MKPSSRSSRAAVDLADSTNQRLNRYALTATAAGVGLTALIQPAQAKIVYTPAHVNFSAHPSLTLDLNHDGIGDFILALGGRGSGGGYYWQSAYISAARSNNKDEVIVTEADGSAPAVALRRGSRIGPGRRFGGRGVLVSHLSHFMKGGATSTRWFDQWANGGKGLKDRYLGLKFYVRGRVHFGWARVAVTTNGKTFTATLTGYAYETIPNKPIVAGKTKGLDDGASGKQASPASFAAPAATPARLGLLALGSHGLTLWRRRDTVAIQ